VAKPSIFSSKYDIEMKRRKRRKIFGIFVFLFAVCIYILISSGTIDCKSIAANIKKINVFNLRKNKTTQNNEDNSKKAVVNTSVKDQSKNKKAVAKKAAEPKTEAKFYSIQFADGKTMKVTYDDSNGNKVIKSVDNSDPDLDYNISPTSNAAVLFEKSTQTMMLVDINGKATDVTNPSYTAQSSGTVFEKNAILKDNPTYVWCSSPKFIDGDNIVYISQIPWFDNRTEKYIWMYNISGNKHSIESIEGTNIQINAVSDKGIEIVSDNNVQYLKGDGTVNK
jgi:major membrane immunogen (membrane-anchored lipoprotein)